MQSFVGKKKKKKKKSDVFRSSEIEYDQVKYADTKHFVEFQEYISGGVMVSAESQIWFEKKLTAALQ